MKACEVRKVMLGELPWEAMGAAISEMKMLKMLEEDTRGRWGYTGEMREERSV